MIIIINGPSGSGKTTLGDYFNYLGLKRIISTTTRKMREGEVEGEDYYFVTEEEFNSLPMIEKSTYSGNQYGVSRDEVERNLRDGSNAYAVLDINGVKRFKELYPQEVKVIYILISKSKMEKRMIARGDNRQSVISRMKFYSKSNERNNWKYADYIVNNNGKINSLYSEGLRILKSLGIVK